MKDLVGFRGGFFLIFKRYFYRIYVYYEFLYIRDIFVFCIISWIRGRKFKLYKIINFIVGICLG